MPFRGITRGNSKSKKKKIKKMPLVVDVCGKSVYTVGILEWDKKFEKRKLIGEKLISSVNEGIGPLFDELYIDKEDFYVAKHNPKTKKTDYKTAMMISIPQDFKIETNRPKRKDDFVKSISVGSNGCIVLLK